jgi:hypothetical protein
MMKENEFSGGHGGGKWGIPAGTKVGLWEELLLVFSVCYLFHFFYFLVAPHIWTQNLRFSPEEFTPWIRLLTREHDGLEVYALYLLMFGCILSSVLIYHFSHFLAGRKGRYLFRTALLAMSGLYFVTIGFHPPMNTLEAKIAEFPGQQTVVAVFAVALIVALLLALQRYAERALLPTVGILLAPLCFIATQSISLLDYGFVFAPALRMLRGASISDIYFQYDLLLSLLAALWMKLNIDLNLFQLLGQLANYLLIFLTFVFSRKLFANKRLSLFLLVSLILLKLYAGIADPVLCFQVTPLRLDWWLVFLALVYFRGPHHWSVGLLCGMLIVLHRSFGLIYGAAYGQLLATLIILDFSRSREKGRKARLPDIIREHLRKSRNNLLLIIASIITGALLFGGLQSKSVQLYQQVGIGFLAIAKNSFYWYVPALVSLVFILLLKLRRSLSRPNLTAGFFLIYLVIGNSLYFFGRSHENNIINISASLLLLFFLLLDLAGRIWTNRAGRLVLVVSLVFVLSLAIFYGTRISERFSVQVKNAVAGRLLFPPEIPKKVFMDGLASVKMITGGSRKVYFISHLDFYYCYYGAYSPLGYFNPYPSWVFKKDLSRFLQGLLDKGYYLAVDNLEWIAEVLPFLRDTRNMKTKSFYLIWKE